MSNASATNLLPGGRTATGAGPTVEAPANKVFQAAVTGTGAVTATVDIEGSIFGGDVWTQLASITLTGTGGAADGFATTAPWPLVRANVKAVTGTGAVVTAGMGV